MKKLFCVRIELDQDEEWMHPPELASILARVCHVLLRDGRVTTEVILAGARLHAEAQAVTTRLNVDLNEVADRCGFPTDEERG